MAEAHSEVTFAGGALGTRSQRTAANRLNRWLREHPLAVLGLVLILGLMVLAVAAEQIAPYDPLDITASSNMALSREHLLGTDPVGKDILSNLIFGARVSLAVGLGAVFLGVTAGGLFGLVTGYLGGPLDLLGQRLIDALIAFPTIIKALVIMAILGPSIGNLVIALAIGYIPTSARVIRSVVLRERQVMYVDAARTIGASPLRIMLRHVLPNSFSPYLVLVTVTVGSAIVAEASLSFLGAGPGANVPSWGIMLAVASNYFFDAAPALAIAPGLAISIAVFGFNVFGDVVRDSLDPRLRKG